MRWHKYKLGLKDGRMEGENEDVYALGIDH
jgi:hypothetical protein